MANIRYLRCAKCGCDATPRRAKIVDGKIEVEAEVGTSTLMRCKDCAEKLHVSEPPLTSGYATMCRDCCPTGHGTRWNVAA